MIKNLFHKAIIMGIVFSSVTSGLNASNEAASAGSNQSIMSSMEAYDWALIGFAGLLLFIIILLANTLSVAMSMSTKPNNPTTKGSGTVPMILIMVTSLLLVNEASAAGSDASSTFNILRAILYVVILLELILIYVLVNWLKIFTGIKQYKTETSESEWSISKIWSKLNKFRPIEEEGEIETGHDYDGIRELDNATPPWFTISFLASIAFAAIYMVRYHVAYSAPNQIEEYNISVKEARAAQMAHLAGQADLVDETNVTMMDEAGIAIGKTLYSGNCVACHGAEGQGGVGPNLTDDYWLHGGSVKDVFKVIKYGVVEKGMKAWQEDFSASQIAQLSSFVLSIHGTNPPGGKEKQGEFFDPKSAPVDTETAPKDSTVNE